jgi:hypothetical protein
MRQPDQRTEAQLTAHHPTRRQWLRLMCTCGVPWQRCPDAQEAIHVTQASTGSNENSHSSEQPHHEPGLSA